MIFGTAHFLRIIAPICGVIALIAISIGLFTGHWLYSEEKMANPLYNRTGSRDSECLSKHTVSGLWSLCYRNPGETNTHCFNIDYFPSEEYSPDEKDSTMAIPYAVIRSAPFFLVAAILLFIGEVSGFVGLVHAKRYTFLGGILLILCGLFLFTGFIVYISVFTDEIGSKLRAASPLQSPVFTYSYGYSFYCAVLGFFSVAAAGISFIFLYVRSVKEANLHLKEFPRILAPHPQVEASASESSVFHDFTNPKNINKKRDLVKAKISATEGHVLMSCLQQGGSPPALPGFQNFSRASQLCPLHETSFVNQPIFRNNKPRNSDTRSMPDISRHDKRCRAPRSLETPFFVERCSDYVPTICPCCRCIYRNERKCDTFTSTLPVDNETELYRDQQIVSERSSIDQACYYTPRRVTLV